MRFVLSRFLTLFLTFTIGVAPIWSAKIFTIAELFVAKKFPSLFFTATGRGCGCGYVQDYSLLTGRKLSEGAVSAICHNTEKEVQTEIFKATKIIERTTKISEFGEDGERVVFLYYSDNSKEERAKILWHGKDGLRFIDAPSLDIGFVFEQTKNSEK